MGAYRGKYQQLFPMPMTAAGTIKTARVVILGIGVAGLQAIATAKRLDAVIEASDVRPLVKEQFESLGAKFIVLAFESPDKKEAAEGVGGYAKPMPASWRERLEDRGCQVRRGRRHRDQHRANTGPRGAGADHRGDGQEHEARLGHRRPRRPLAPRSGRSRVLSPWPQFTAPLHVCP